MMSDHIGYCFYIALTSSPSTFLGVSALQLVPAFSRSRTLLRRGSSGVEGVDRHTTLVSVLLHYAIGFSLAVVEAIGCHSLGDTGQGIRR